eukprot:6491520-Amphidinium_carterae.1
MRVGIRCVGGDHPLQGSGPRYVSLQSIERNDSPVRRVGNYFVTRDFAQMIFVNATLARGDNLPDYSLSSTQTPTVHVHGDTRQHQPRNRVRMCMCQAASDKR